MSNLKKRDEGPANNVYTLNIERMSEARRALTVSELAEIRQMLAEHRQSHAELEMVKQCCPVARNIFRVPGD